MPFQTLPANVQIEGLPSASQADRSVIYVPNARENGVVVRYGSTKLTADRLVVYGDEERGVAEGHVVLVDPAGTVYADRVEVGWNPVHRYAKGDNVSLRVGNATLRARHADFDPQAWQLYDVEGTTCLRGTPVYYVTSDRVDVSPQQQAVIHQPRVSVLGKFIAELPTQQASLIAAVPGIGYPSLVYKRDKGVGVALNGGLLAGHQGLFDYASNVFTGRKPTGFTQYTYSFLPLRRATEVAAPAGDFGERFTYGFLNNSFVRTPDQEERYLRAERSSLTFGGQINSGGVDRGQGVQYDKIETVYEVGGAQGPIGYLGQARLQGIQPLYADMQPRLQLIGALSGPMTTLRPRLQLLSRIDSAAFLGRTAYGWTEGTAGMTYLPVNWFRLSAGGYLSGDLGTPQFGIDPLHARRGALGRADVGFGGFRFTYLLKEDERLGLYDHEFDLTQVVGCFQIFYNKREFPHTRHVGITLNLEPFVNAVKQRTAELTGSPIPPTKRL